MTNNLKQLGLGIHNGSATADSFDFGITDGTSNTRGGGLFNLTGEVEITMIGLLLPAVQKVREAAARADDDDGTHMLLGDGSVRSLNDGGNFQFGDGSVRFAADPAPMADIEVHTVRHEVVNDALF